LVVATLEKADIFTGATCADATCQCSQKKVGNRKIIVEREMAVAETQLSRRIYFERGQQNADEIRKFAFYHISVFGMRLSAFRNFQCV
jgi:hypothetical protein